MLFLAAPGLAITQTFDVDTNPILGGDDDAYIPDVTIKFTYDDTCMTSSCDLEIVLTYNGASQSMVTIGQTLAGVAFDTFSGATQFDLAVVLASSSVIAESLVGAGSDQALTDFGGPPNSNLDISGHWGFRSGFSSTGIQNPLGTNLLSSVGDAFPDTDVLGMGDLFSGTISSVEPNPPDGTSFSIVDDATCTGPPGTPTCGGLNGGFQDSQNRAWVQNSATATLVYDGTTNKLTSITNVDPIFGTEGRPVPAPGMAGFLLMGLVGLALRPRSR